MDDNNESQAADTSIQAGATQVATSDTQQPATTQAATTNTPQHTEARQQQAAAQREERSDDPAERERRDAANGADIRITPRSRQTVSITVEDQDVRRDRTSATDQREDRREAQPDRSQEQRREADQPRSTRESDARQESSQQATESSTEEGVVFTAPQQQRLNQLTGQARDEGRSSAYRYVFNELGVSSLNDLRTLVGEARDRRANNDQELLTAQGHADDLRQQVEQRQSLVEAADARADRALRLAEIRVIASELRFRDVNDPINYLRDRMSDFAVDREQETVSGIREALTALAEQKPYLIETSQAVAPVSDPTPAASDNTDEQTRQKQEALGSLRGQIKSWF